MELGAKIRSAIRWGAGVKLIGQVFTWAMTIVVIRLLTPDDYGLMAMSVLFVQFLMLLNELGLGAVLVHRGDLDNSKKRQIFGLVIWVNSVFFLLLFFAAPSIALFFSEDQLTLIVRVLAFQFIISAFGIIPTAHLERNLDFKRKSLVFLIASVAGGVATLLLALKGFGVWALIWGNMLILFLQTVGVNLVSPFPYKPTFSLKGMRDVVSFGGLVTIERAMWFFYTQADVFIIGKLLGKELLGIYSVAMHLASLIMHKTGGIIYEIAFPSFARANEEPEKVAIYFLKAVRIMAVITFPLFLGMSSVAPELVSVLLGEKWEMAGGVLAILSLVMPLRMIANLLPPALQGIGRPDASVSNLFIAVIAMPIAFIIGAQWGLIGVSISWVGVYPIVFAIIMSRSIGLLGVSSKQVIGAMWKPLLVSMIMYALVILSKTMMPIEGPSGDLARLVISIIAGIVLYISLSILFYKNAFKEVLELVNR